MSMTAFEQNRHLNIDLGDGTIVVIPPIPGKTGREMLGLLTSVSFGTDLANAEANAQRLARLALGLSAPEYIPEGGNSAPAPAVGGLPGADEREALYEGLRASEQERVAQAAILWNVQGGSIDAVRDLLDTEAGEAYPKALGRVMRSCGLGPQFEALRIWLSGASGSQTLPESTDPTTGRNGISNTSA